MGQIASPGRKRSRETTGRRASFADKIPESLIRSVASRADAAQVAHPLHFGESDVPTPRVVVEAGQRALADGYTFYPPGQGYLDLRVAISDLIKRLHAVDVDPDSEVIVTGSGVTGSLLAALALFGPGDEVIVITPTWPNSAVHVTMAGAQPVFVPLGFSDRWALDVDLVAAAVTPRTTGIVFASPSNPCGWTASVDEARKLAALSSSRGLWLVADETYERLTYEGSHAVSQLALADRSRLVITNSFSKSYAMTGWRVGYSIAPPAICRQMTILQEYVVSSASAVAQRAGLVAIAGCEDFISEQRTALRAQAASSARLLSQVDGVAVMPAEGGLFAYFGLPPGLSATSVSDWLIANASVSTVPSAAFYDDAERLRICIARNEAALASSLEVLTDGLARITKGALTA